MESYLVVLIALFSSLLLLMLTGLPVAFAFLPVAFVAMFLLSGEQGIEQLTRSLTSSIMKFSLLPLPLFILMGEVMFHSGIAPAMIDVLDRLVGRLPGRLGLLAVGSGTMLATLTGSTTGAIAMLGSVLVPQMEKAGYRTPMSLGPILGSGGLAIMIPPSAMAVLIGAVGEVSIGQLLIAILIPGLLMSLLYVGYIIVRCYIQPHIAPAHEIPDIPLRDKVVGILRHILPLAFIIFVVIGVIFMGIATPTEAAASGALGTFILAAAYKRLNWQMVKESLAGTLNITVMIFMIIATAQLFSQVIAFTGASRGIVGFILQLNLPGVSTILALLAVILFLGMFIPSNAHIMIVIPLSMPIIHSLGYDAVWFSVIYLLATEMGQTSPPYGSGLYVMRGVAPPGTKFADIYKAALPFLGCDLIAMAFIVAFPSMALWLPSIMR